MDLSLWDAPVFQVADDHHFCNRNDWYCDFHFGYGQDVIEEDALNETSCMQVLKILIAKTDDEILQLDNKISVLETSLAIANTELTELCSVVRETSDCLEKPIQLCEDVHDEHDSGLQLQPHTEPAKGPPCKDLQQKPDQCGSATASIPSILAGVGNEKNMSKISEAPEGEKIINDFNSLDKGLKQNPHDIPQQNIRKFTELATAPMRSLFLAAEDVGLQKVAMRVLDPETEERKKVSDLLHNDEMEEPSENPQKKMELIPVEKEAASNVACVTEVKEPSVVSLPSADVKVASSAPRSKKDSPVCFVENSCRSLDYEKRLETSRQKKGSRKKPELSQQNKMKTDPLLQMKGKRKRFTEMEPISVDSLIELINGRKDANRSPNKVRGKLQTSHIKEPKAFLANGSIRREYTKLKRKHHVKPETVEQSLAEESGYNVASLEKNRRKKSETDELLGFNNKNVKREEEEGDLVGTKLADGPMTSIITTATHTPNVDNESSILPLSYEKEDSNNIQIEHAKIHDILMKIKLEENDEIMSCSSMSDSKVQIAEKSVSDLEHMTLPKLKDIARRYNLKRYNKLTKAKLVSFLAKELNLFSSHQ